MGFEALLEAYRAEVNARLEQLLPVPTGLTAEFQEAMGYACLAPGKRLRPILVLLACESVGGDRTTAIDAACAVEMVHCFSLIHDDLPALDNDDLRRGRPTVHKQYSEAIAILAGDALLALAFEAIAGSPAPPDKIVGAILTLGAATGSQGLAGGEIVDLQSEGKPASAETIQFIHSHKTGALIRACCEIGGILGGGTEAQIRALREFGSRVGLAFQIADDILGETATADRLGKPVGRDQALAKATYPSVFGLCESFDLAEHEVTLAIRAIQGLTNRHSELEAIARLAIDRTS